MVQTMEREKNTSTCGYFLDGNGRWARKEAFQEPWDAPEGCKVVEQTVEDAARLGISFLTVYALHRKLEAVGRRSKCFDAVTSLLYEETFEGSSKK